jgi:hypothetical protein
MVVVVVVVVVKFGDNGFDETGGLIDESEEVG